MPLDQYIHQAVVQRVMYGVGKNITINYLEVAVMY